MVLGQQKVISSILDFQINIFIYPCFLNFTLDPDPIFATLKMASACRSRRDDPDGSMSPPLEPNPSLDYGADMIFMRSAVKQTDRYAGKVTVANTSSAPGGRPPMLRQQSAQQTSRDYGM